MVLFYYSGHGSRESAPEEFHRFFPDKMNETLICHDSRTENGTDLSDKEIAVLLHLIPNNPHILVIADSRV